MPVPEDAPLPPDIRAELRGIEDPRNPRAVELRLALLRAEVPETVIQLDTVRADDTAIAIRATIGRSGGGRASVISSTDVDPEVSWSEQLQHVEALALARALDQLGMTFERATQAPVTAVARPPISAPVQEKPQDKDKDNDHLSEFGWNAFWQQAHAAGITRDQVEQALGRSVREASPQQAIEALRLQGSWPTPK